jgi:hypothetical protein
MARRVALLAVAVVGALSAGCAYAKDRARDFSQIVRIEAGVAIGFDVDTRLGGLLDFGMGAGYSWDAALLYGEPFAGKESRILAPGFCQRAIGPTHVWSHTCHDLLPPVFARETYVVPELTHLGTPLHEFDVEAEVTALVVHVRVGVSPGELADAFLGIFGVDIAGDDGGKKPPPFVEPKPAPPPAPAKAPPAARPPGGAVDPDDEPEPAATRAPGRDEDRVGIRPRPGDAPPK